MDAEIKINSRMALCGEVERFLDLNPEVKPTRLGEEACGNRHIVKHLRAGKDVNTGTMDRIMIYICGYNNSKQKA